MFRMAVGHSDDIDLDAALEEVFAQAGAGLDGAQPRAGLLFASWATDHQALLDAIVARYPGIELAGSTTAGEMSSVMGFQEDSIALALFASDEVEMTAGLANDLSTDPAAVVREAVDQARSKATKPAAMCIALPTISVVEAGDVLDALRNELGPDVPILGGGAAAPDPSMDPRATSSRQFAGNVIADGGIAILLFSGPLTVSFGVETGWRGVGPRVTVTRVSPEGVMEIDGRPALDLYERYTGTRVPAIANPLAVFDSADSESFILRTPTTYDRETGRVAFFGAVPEGATVQLTVAASDEIFEGTVASIADAVAGFPGNQQPDAALVYSCATRRFLLGTRAGHEVELIREKLGPAIPVAGFYCMGEIAPVPPTDDPQFHNATMVSVLLGQS